MRPGTCCGSLQAVANDFNSGQDPSEDLDTPQADATQLQSDAQALKGDLPPSCVPGMRHTLNSAMNDASRVATDTEQLVTGTRNGNNAAETADVADIVNVAKAYMATNRKHLAAVNDFSEQNGIPTS